MSKSSSLKSIASFSKCKSFEGKAYLYSDLNKKLQQHLQNNRTITKIFVYQSPLVVIDNAKEAIKLMIKKQALNFIEIGKDKEVQQVVDVVSMVAPGVVTILALASYAGMSVARQIIKHHQIILEIQQMVYALLSFGQDGLQCGIHGEPQPLVQRRYENKKIFQFSTNIRGQTIRDFLINNQNKTYHMTLWNCQHFCDAFLIALK